MHLPVEPVPLQLKLAWPAECLSRFEEGYESQDQDEKWSFYFSNPWLEVWRPMRGGILAYVVKIGKGRDNIEVEEAWAAKQIVELMLPTLPEKVLGNVLDHFVGYVPSKDYGVVCTQRNRTKVKFSGEIETQADLVRVVQALQEQLQELGKQQARLDD